MAIRDRSAAAKKGWARRRLGLYLNAVRKYLGFTPDKVTIYADDYDLLHGRDDRIELVRGPSKPPCDSEKIPIHH